MILPNNSQRTWSMYTHRRLVQRKWCSSLDHFLLTPRTWWKVLASNTKVMEENRTLETIAFPVGKSSTSFPWPHKDFRERLGGVRREILLTYCERDSQGPYYNEYEWERMRRDYETRTIWPITTSPMVYIAAKSILWCFLDQTLRADMRAGWARRKWWSEGVKVKPLYWQVFQRHNFDPESRGLTALTILSRAWPGLFGLGLARLTALGWALHITNPEFGSRSSRTAKAWRRSVSFACLLLKCWRMPMRMVQAGTLTTRGSRGTNSILRAIPKWEGLRK